jgi:hypothetical protein
MFKHYYITLAFSAIWGIAVSPCVAATKMPSLAVPNGFGVNIHFRGEPRDLDLIVDAGFKFIRMDLTWEAVERRVFTSLTGQAMTL